MRGVSEDVSFLQVQEDLLVKRTLRLRLCVSGNCIAAAAALCLSEARPDIWLTPAAAAALIPVPERIKLETVIENRVIF